MSVTTAAPRHLKYIEHLSAKHAEDLGFLSREALSAYLARGRVTLAEENGDPCGYLLVGAPAQRQRIFHACIQHDARNVGHARELIGILVTAAALRGTTAVTLHCRDGLDANTFWPQIGFQPTGVLLGGGARRKVVLEWSLDVTDALGRADLPYCRRFLAAVAAGASPRLGSRTFTPPSAAPAAGKNAACGGFELQSVGHVRLRLAANA